MADRTRRGMWIFVGIVAALMAGRTPCRAADGSADARGAIELVPVEYREAVARRMDIAGENRAELADAINRCKPEQRDGMSFLVANMPESDLRALKAEFLLKNVGLAYAARDTHPWAAKVPTEVFLDDVLPYANVNERRDDWRGDFVARFGPMVKDCKTATEAAQLLNREVFKVMGVKYHATKRRKPDQSPYESRDVGYASCTGLSIILADACRAVGVPARVVGTPHWSDDSGNHTWVEFWDGQWWYIGAAEPGELNETWFSAQAAKADDSRPEYRIYAASFRRTNEPFIMIWSRRTDISAVDVSKYYIHRQKMSVGTVGGDGMPVESVIRVMTGDRTVGEMRGSSGTFDIGADADYRVRASVGERWVEQQVHLAAGGDAEVRLVVADPALVPVVTKAAEVAAPAAASKVIEELRAWLAKPRAERSGLEGQAFAKASLTKAEAAEAKGLLWDDYAANLRSTRESEWKANEVVAGGKTMKFLRKNFGTKPEGGWNLFISMHGGGNAPAGVNDQQWQNQIKLYEPANSLYIAPRAPTNTWNLWHEPHIDALFDQMIREAIVLEGVNPDRVYIMGYSAGGDGVYQLAPRMADRLAAAAMMAGHPNDASPLGLRNIGFTIHVGALDNGYDRNKIAEKWKGLLDDLHKADPAGYKHEVQLHAGRPHWMNREDAVAVDWMAKFTREAFPDRVVWKQASTTHERFYWLAMPADQAKAGQEIVVRRSGQDFEILKAEGAGTLTILLNDEMVDLDRPVKVTMSGRTLFEGPVQRTAEVLAETLTGRGDPGGIYSGRVTVAIEAAK